MRIIKNFTLSLLAAVALFALPACERGDEGGNGGDKKDVIVLDRQFLGYYFGKVWDFQDEQHADYYLILAKGEVGQSVQTGLEVPMEVGGWVLFLDLWAEASEDTANAVIPEGEYTFSDQRDMFIVYDQYSIATANVEKVGNQYRILDRQFTGGTVNVEHTSKGYLIEACFTTIIDDEEVELNFKYEGAIKFDDKSDDEPWDPGMNEDFNIFPISATVDTRDKAADGVTTHIVRLFDTKMSEDGTHPGATGHMISLTLYTELGADFVGSYVPGTMKDNGVMIKEAGVFYPGKFYGSVPLGSIIERVHADQTTESDILTGGTINVRKTASSEYAFDIDLTTGKGHKVTCDWVGKVDEFVTTQAALQKSNKRGAELTHTNYVEIR